MTTNVVSMTIFSIDYQVVIMDFLTTGVLNYCTADYLLTTPKISQCDYFIVFSVKCQKWGKNRSRKTGLSNWSKQDMWKKVIFPKNFKGTSTEGRKVYPWAEGRYKENMRDLIR